MEETRGKRDVVVLLFPFSDLSATKKRPALILTTLQGEDIILCQITSEARNDAYSSTLLEHDFQEGSLHITSMIRPNKMFTADKSIIVYKVGTLKDKKIQEVQRVVVSIFEQWSFLHKLHFHFQLVGSRIFHDDSWF